MTNSLSKTPTPTLTPEQLLKAAQECSSIQEMEDIGQKCFRPYAEAIEKGTHEKGYVITLPGRQGYTDIFAYLNSQGLVAGVNSEDGKYHIFQHCHYIACYTTEKREMPQTLETQAKAPSTVRELFGDVMQPDEKLKIRFGQRVVLNDSSIGETRDNLTAELYKQISVAALSQDGKERGEIPLTPKGNPKTPAIEVVAVNGKGKEGERILFRQENEGSTISVNLIGELASQRIQAEAEPELGATVARSEENAVAETEPQTVTTKAYSEESIEAGEEAQLIDSETNLPTDMPIQDSSRTQTGAGRQTDESAVETLRRSVSNLPHSQTKELWQRFANEVTTLSSQLKAIAQTKKQLDSTVLAVPKAITNDTKALIESAQQSLSNIRRSLQTTARQTSIEDISGLAIKTAGKVAEAGNNALGRTSHYLKDRADKVKSYGMAKAALSIYHKGHARTEESIFTADGYTVEAVTEGYKIKDPQDRLIMSFATDQNGKPISITKEIVIQPIDYKKLNRAAKTFIIKGSPQAEAAYDAKLIQVIEGIKLAIPLGESRSGSNFTVNRHGTDNISISTIGYPQRSLIADKETDKLDSSLTIADLRHLENSVDKEIAGQQTKIEKEKVGVEMG
jgi:hypothetical protein